MRWGGGAGLLQQDAVETALQLPAMWLHAAAAKEASLFPSCYQRQRLPVSIACPIRKEMAKLMA
jgi:hypothetical protein